MEILVFQSSQCWLWHYGYLEGRAPGPAGLSPPSPASGAWEPPLRKSPAPWGSTLWLKGMWDEAGGWGLTVLATGMLRPRETEPRERGNCRGSGQCWEPAWPLIASLQGEAQVGLGIKDMHPAGARGEVRAGRLRPAWVIRVQG